MSTRRDLVRDITIPAGAATLEGEIVLPPAARGVVLFAHGLRSSRHSPRNQFVARAIREAGCGTLLLDLLTRQEEVVDLQTRQLRFDIDLLAGRLVEATEWMRRERVTRQLPLGYFGASTGGATHLFEEPGALERVAELAARWFSQHVGAGPR